MVLGPLSPRQPFSDEAVKLATEAIRSGTLFGVGGPLITRFEAEFAAYYGAKHAVTVSSGTAAIHTALAALDPAPGREVITAPITDAGSVLPILYQGCVPVFADVDEHLGMSPAAVEACVSDRTAAIIAVHPFGGAADARALRDIADRHGIALIEDCSQAHATRFDGRFLGRYGRIGVYSLQQSKHMTAGEGGVCTTDDDRLADEMRLFRDKGWDRVSAGARGYPRLGLNYRATELVAAVALPQLGTLDDVIARRRRLAEVLDAAVDRAPDATRWTAPSECDTSYWCYPFFVPAGQTAAWGEALAAQGVPTSPGYIGDPIYTCLTALRPGQAFGGSGYPLTLAQEGRGVYPPGLCPNAEEALSRLMVFWLHEDHTDEEIAAVGEAIVSAGRALAG
ncbi:dTDP-4-amino-4,6-dideoxygalactose transaminase [Labedaea rhizosphaerae]|uniref:dTDP-4-amino-4,6-dideoxygalactose transaminase n=1 Tax=Labedaea rhizosphaerae TaxID=598644 RepID=A0A4R6S6Y4_LABRH|nr:dTDP-4-amino-4,6-dideoxygalactose transaminase [Labedaea rhizosphaerae]